MPAASPRFDNSYARLPERFYSRLPPRPVAQPQLIRVNEPLAIALGIDPRWLTSPAGIQALAGNTIPAGAEPIATVYAGHQFGGWNPQLGDGRALLWGEVIDPAGRRHDIQLKGSGPTPYSRGGDGRAPLGPVMREFIVSEAMAALGIPTTRTLAAVTTGETVYRDRALPGAVLARVAQSHIRIGTVQYFAARQDESGLRSLLDHVIARHYPSAARAEQPYLALFDAVVGRQASLVAHWQLVGFIHGVMNTDNMLLSGETIDYGPCAFMDSFQPDAVYSSIDRGGRYAYGNQPPIAQWNLMCLAQAMLPLLGENRDAAVAAAQPLLESFTERFAQARQRILNQKLGLVEDSPQARQLGMDLFDILAQEQTDLTLTFRRLTELASPTGEAEIRDIFDLPEAFGPWLARWRKMLAEQPHDPTQGYSRMRRVNPVFIARNHLVEEVIASATENGDFQPMHDWIDILNEPYRYAERLQRYARPPRPEQVVTATFCGT